MEAAPHLFLVSKAAKTLRTKATLFFLCAPLMATEDIEEKEDAMSLNNCEYMTVKEVAERLGVSKSLVRRWIARGAISSERSRDQWTLLVPMKDVAWWEVIYTGYHSGVDAAQDTYRAIMGSEGGC